MDDNVECCQRMPLINDDAPSFRANTTQGEIHFPADYKGKWVILLALTSNKGSHDFQLTADANGERLFEKVLRVSQQWGNDENMMYVVGATQGRMFEDIRRVAPNHFLLVPGIGAQGGSLEEVCRYGMNTTCGLIVNSSRAIIYADKTENFARVAAEKAHEVQQQMAEQLKQIL